MSNSNINFNVIKEIQDKADIVAVISRFIRLTRKGNNYVGLCPFHPDKNPSLIVSPKKKIFKCFVCNAKGNVFSFIQQYNKVSFIEAVKQVAQLINFDVNKLESANINSFFDERKQRIINANKQANEWFKGFLNNKSNKDKLDYLHNRNISDAIIKDFEFGYAPKDKNLIYKMLTNADEMFGKDRDVNLVWKEKELLDAGLITITQDGNVFDFFINRITIPIYDNNGYLVGFSGRTTEKDAQPKYLNSSSTLLFNKSAILFNFFKVKQLHPEKIIVVEGFMDAIAYIRAGYDNVIATMGVALTNEHMNALSTLTNLNTIILSFDNDTAGVYATIQHGENLMQNGFNVYVVAPYDSSIKDVDELLNKKDKEAIKKIVEERTDFITFLINNEFKVKKPLDEIQKSVNLIIKKMISFGSSSILFREQHLKLLAEKSGLAVNDLKAKYEIDYKKELDSNLISSKPTYTPKPYKPTNTYGVKETFKEPNKVELKEQKEEPIKENSYISTCKKLKASYLKQLQDACDCLIQIMITNPKMIDSIIDKFDIPNEEYITIELKYIFKSINYMYETEREINEQSVSTFLKTQAEKNNEVSKDYRFAQIYFDKLFNNPIYIDVGQRSYQRNNINRVEQIIKMTRSLITDIKKTNHYINEWNKRVK